MALDHLFHPVGDGLKVVIGQFARHVAAHSRRGLLLQQAFDFRHALLRRQTQQIRPLTGRQGLQPAGVARQHGLQPRRIRVLHQLVVQLPELVLGLLVQAVEPLLLALEFFLLRRRHLGQILRGVCRRSGLVGRRTGRPRRRSAPRSPRWENVSHISLGISSSAKTPSWSSRRRNSTLSA